MMKSWWCQSLKIHHLKKIWRNVWTPPCKNIPDQQRFWCVGMVFTFGETLGRKQKHSKQRRTIHIRLQRHTINFYSFVSLDANAMIISLELLSKCADSDLIQTHHRLQVKALNRRQKNKANPFEKQLSLRQLSVWEYNERTKMHKRTKSVNKI